jgi:predicted RNA-binding protein
MNYWIFIVTSHKADGELLAGEDILQQRMKDGFWGLAEKTPNRNSLQQGDQVVFYVGNPIKAFAGRAVLAGESFKLSEEERDRYSHGKNFYRAEYGVRLEQIQLWERRVAVESLVPHLRFIENKEFWFAYFQGGVRQVSEEDFRSITEGPAPAVPGKQPATEDIEGESEFALEAHLEEFLDKNWENIDFGVRLARYQTEDQDGRQFPAGPWSIDFLCVDRDGGDLVVLELKRGKSSDSTVGQILRYMGWVKKNLAGDGQKIRGVIIAKEVDEALGYAVQDLKDVRVLTYKVDFKLSPFKK